MSPLSRPILASLLCGMIVLGQAPAWLHVGTCDGHGHGPERVSLAAEPTISVCAHGCSHHTSTTPTAETPTAEPSTTSDMPDSGDPHQHDSDTCVVCQSLVSPNGVHWELLTPLPTQYVSQPIFVATESVLLATLLSIPQPRGPPVAA